MHWFEAHTQNAQQHKLLATRFWRLRLSALPSSKGDKKLFILCRLPATVQIIFSALLPKPANLAQARALTRNRNSPSRKWW